MISKMTLQIALVALFLFLPGMTSASAEHIYSLPFKGKHRVSQAWGGVTHINRAHYAYDFPMKRGTPIYAARAGVVKKVEEDFGEVPKDLRSLVKRRPNFVYIEHSDGTRAHYQHLQENGVVVEVGDYVKEGQLIGYSGNTGKSSGPHLHFAVLKKEKGKKPETIPMKFKTREEGSIYLERGKRYSSL